ncbi:MAG: McrB family protein [Promethearchaeota archaeon]
MENSTNIWKCPRDSCKQKEIMIKRTNQNTISSKTYERIILHFLQHLKKDNIYFGSVDLYKIFEENLQSELLHDEDLNSYESDPSHFIWQTNLRSVLDRVIKNKMKYIETEDSDDIPEFYNNDIEDKRKKRTRKRTLAFFDKFEVYDDWELYKVPINQEVYSGMEIIPKKEPLINIQYWSCPQNSCGFEKIPIERNSENIITSSTYLRIITHFLQHLTKDNVFFGAPIIYDIFLKHTPPNILSKEDQDFYTATNVSLKWKIRINSALAKFKDDGYLETYSKSEVFKIYNLNDEFKNIYGTRKRSEKFIQEFELYDDWEYYKSPLKKLTNKDQERVFENLEDFETRKETRIRWICPLEKCGNLSIEIQRNEDNTISGSFFKDLIIHFMQHLKKNNTYFGPSDIYDYFMESAPADVLSTEDKKPYTSNLSDPNWKVKIRSVLAGLKKADNYIETDDEGIDETYIRKFRTRRRTKKFFEEYDLYDDWKLYTVEKELDDDLFLEKPRADYSNFQDSNIEIKKIKSALLNKKQIILMGPPGTSKSYLAEQIAFDMILDSTRYEIVQFHPSFSYEDFVEGIVTESSEEIPLKFVPKKKIFRIICEEAKKLEKNEYFILIIDEINRGNVEKIFGELIWALEKRNKPITTVYFDEALEIPENLLIIGTMNTVDLSIANIDAALRRRFHIIPIMPDKKVLENWLKDRYGENFLNFQTFLVNLMDKLNEKIEQDSIYLGPYRQLGQTYFFIEPERTIELLKEKIEIEWEFSIKPLLLEYFNFNEENLKDYEEIYNNFKKQL